MKRLYLLRHSKAGQTNKKLLDDHERDLTDKGIEMCSVVGTYFKTLTAPQRVISSTAIRAKQTAELVIQETGFTPEFEFTQKLYLASTVDIYTLIHSIPDEINSVLLVGHNPGFQDFAIDVAGKGDKKLFREMRNHFPPPSLATFDFDLESWGLVDTQKGILVAFQSSKTL